VEERVHAASDIGLPSDKQRREREKEREFILKEEGRKEAS